MKDERSEPFPQELTGELVRRAKKQLRQRGRALRLGIPASALARRSERINEALFKLPEIEHARAVALFWPMVDRGEVDLRPTFRALRGQNVATFFPFMEPIESGYRTGFRQAADESELSESDRGFMEPPPGSAALRGEIAAVVVPALAVDSRGFRLGYGAGYYDATLGDVCPPAVSIAVCYDFELVAELPIEPHDLGCDIIVTDVQVIRVRR